MIGRVDLAEFLPGFVAEADDQLAVATANLLAIEQAGRNGSRDPRSLREAYRALHTLKGLSSMVGVDAVVSIAHAMESVLRPVDSDGGSLEAAAIDPLMKGVRAMEVRVRALERGEGIAAAPADLLIELDALAGGAAPARAPGARARARLALDPAIEGKLAPFERELLMNPTGGRHAVRIEFAPSPERGALGATINTVRDRVGAIAEIVRVLPISMTAGPRAPAGFVFVLLVLTSARDDELAEACGIDPSCVTRLRDARERNERDERDERKERNERNERDERKERNERDERKERNEPSPTVPDGTVSRDARPTGEGQVATDSRAADGGTGVMAPQDDAALDTFDTAPPRGSHMRVDVARVDDAMGRLGVLLVTGAGLAGAIGRLSATGVDTRELAQVVHENARQLRDLRSSILQLRMVPVIDVLERLSLIVRALERSSGKVVALKLEGGGAELDKAVADRVFPALVHLVRNAVDHGIEPPEVRRRARKPAEGSLRVTCVSRSSAGVVFSVEDDGGGIDARAVARRAGWPETDVPTSDAALLDMLCQPGLSTRDQATTTSGRGLGMDIVKRIVVDQLGGEMVLRSEPGKGTAFALHVPLTVAMTDAFVIECGAQRFAVPVSGVEEVVEIDSRDLVQPPGRTADAGPPTPVRLVGVVPRRRETLALYAFAPSAASAPPSHSTAAGATATVSLKALVVRRRGEPVGLVVDRVVGQQEAVVRPIVDPLVRVPGIAGATELGDGRATLVIDIGALTAASRAVVSRAPNVAGPASDARSRTHPPARNAEPEGVA